jgi:hypothetical protein
MATRRERYLKMREKHKRRRERHYDEGRAYTYSGPRTAPARKTFRAGKHWDLTRKGLQDPLRLKQSSYVHGPVYGFSIGQFMRGLHPAEYRQPPVPFIWGVGYDEMRSESGHQVMAWHGYHRRRVTLWGRNPGRMNGTVRRWWGASQYYWFHGFWPDWDPAKRSPSWTEVTTGAEDPNEQHIWVPLPAGID